MMDNIDKGDEVKLRLHLADMTIGHQKRLKILLELYVCYTGNGEKVIACTHERGDIDATFIGTLTPYDIPVGSLYS